LYSAQIYFWVLPPRNWEFAVLTVKVSEVLGFVFRSSLIAWKLVTKDKLKAIEENVVKEIGREIRR